MWEITNSPWNTALSSPSVQFGSFSYTTASTAICPDLLRLEQLGEAGGFRGRLVRGFFRLLKLVGL